jgi:hypothetical protein
MPLGNRVSLHHPGMIESHIVDRSSPHFRLKPRPRLPLMQLVSSLHAIGAVHPPAAFHQNVGPWIFRPPRAAPTKLPVDGDNAAVFSRSLNRMPQYQRSMLRVCSIPKCWDHFKQFNLPTHEAESAFLYRLAAASSAALDSGEFNSEFTKSWLSSSDSFNIVCWTIGWAAISMTFTTKKNALILSGRLPGVKPSLPDRFT